MRILQHTIRNMGIIKDQKKEENLVPKENRTSILKDTKFTLLK